MMIPMGQFEDVRRERSSRVSSVVVGVLVVMAVLLAVSGGVCTDEAGASTVLRAAGYTDVVVGGHEFSCGDDLNCTGFRATGPTGYRVKGAVGCGPLKGCTIRITGAVAPP